MLDKKNNKTKGDFERSLTMQVSWTKMQRHERKGDDKGNEQ